MNQDHDPDELSGQLDALGEALQRPPRADARVEAALGATPPMAGLGGPDPTDVMVVPMTAPPPQRRTAWVAVAAAVALLAGVGVVAYAMGDDDPALPALAGDGETGESTDEPDPSGEEPPSDDSRPDNADPEPGGDGDAEPPAELGDSLEEHRVWLECVTDQFKSMFEGGFPPPEGRFPQIDECGDAPAIGGALADGFGFCLAPETGEGETGSGCALHEDGWFPFDDLPDFGELPHAWSFPGLGDWESFDEICSSESTETSVDVRCAWPPCADGDGEAECPFPPECADADSDDSEPVGCFDFDFGFGLEVLPEGFEFSVPFGGEGHFFVDPEMLPDTFPDLLDDFEFPRDLRELVEWFEDFPWADEFDGLFGEPEPTDA